MRCRHGDGDGRRSDGEAGSFRWLDSPLVKIISAVAAVFAIFGISISGACSPRGLSATFLGGEDGDAIHLMQTMGDKPLYRIFSKEIEPNGVSYFNSSCTTQLILRNHDDETAVLTKFVLVADDIEPDIKAELVIDMDWDGSDLAGAWDGGLYVRVGNAGWGEASSLECSVSSDERGFVECFGDGPIVAELDGVGVGETERLRILGTEDLVRMPEERVVFTIAIELLSADGEEFGSARAEYDVAVEPDGTIKWATGGMGDSSPAVYGIFINTGEEACTFSESVNLEVGGNDVLSIPICFFPDKSCHMKCHIEFYDESGRLAVKTSPNELSFDLDSRAKSMEAYDATKLTAEQLAEIAQEMESDWPMSAVAFPFVWENPDRFVEDSGKV